MSTVTRAQILNIRYVSKDIKEYTLLPQKFSQYEAGQFLQLTLEEVSASDYWPESRSFSIASCISNDKTLRLIIKRVGRYKQPRPGHSVSSPWQRLRGHAHQVKNIDIGVYN